MKLKLVDKLISHEIVGRSGVTAIWLVSVYLFLAFLELVEDTSLEDQIMLILHILIVSVPRMIYELSPMIFLIGALLALMNLSKSSELLALQAGGLSKRRITTSIVGTSLVFAVLILAWGEFVVPVCESLKSSLTAGDNKSELSDEPDFVNWIRDDNRFIYVEGRFQGTQQYRVHIYHFDENGRLYKQTESALGKFDEDSDQLFLYHVNESNLIDGILEPIDNQELYLTIRLNHDVVRSQHRDPAELNLIELYQTIRYLRKNGLNAEILDLSFWNRFVIPLSIIVMAAFAMLFNSKTNRGVNRGILVLVGLLFGLVYFAVQQSAGYFAIISGWPPVIGTFTILCLFSIAALIAQTEKNR